MASHYEVAKRWAEHSGPIGRTKRDLSGHHVWMDGDTIFSYGRHYFIAQWVTMASGERIALFNARHSSVSTEKQKGIVRSAFHQWGGGCVSLRTWMGSLCESDLAEYDAEIAAEEARISRARVYKSRDHWERLTNERALYASYLSQTGRVAA